MLQSFLLRPICAGPGFTGKFLETPKKIVVLMPFGFEVEIHVEKWILLKLLKEIQYNSMTGGHFRNCSERAAGPG